MMPGMSLGLMLAEGEAYLVASLFWLFLFLLQLPAYLQEVFTIMLGLLIEAFPFIMLGVLVSTLIALYLKEEWLVRFIPKNRFLSYPVIALFGVLLPLCECGNVPVARRLMTKKFTPSQAITFMLAAPIINPITVFTTVEAFRVDPHVAMLRVVAGFLIAVIIGLLFSYQKNQQDLLSNRFYVDVCDADHGNGALYGLVIFQREFLELFGALFIGALLAASMQVLVPQQLLASVGHDPLLSIFAMVVLGFIISMCSTVDAFFALSYTQTFTLGSLVTFMVFEPMINIKILSMLKTTFSTRTLLILSFSVAVLSIGVGIYVNVFYRLFL